jgi:DNA-binding response OmpR family regulator
MWVESAVGVGSTFGFAIPVVSRTAEDASADRDGEFPVVVLVDDDRASLDLMSAYLDDAPVQVIRATDGESALELIHKVLPAAVVLDIQLPRLDGWHVLAELKAAEDTAAIPVVIASVVDDRPKGTRLGANVQLLKPVSRDDLIGALRSVGVHRKGGG